MDRIEELEGRKNRLMAQRAKLEGGPSVIRSSDLRKMERLTQQIMDIDDELAILRDAHPELAMHSFTGDVGFVPPTKKVTEDKPRPTLGSLNWKSGDIERRTKILQANQGEYGMAAARSSSCENLPEREGLSPQKGRSKSSMGILKSPRPSPPSSPLSEPSRLSPVPLRAGLLAPSEARSGRGRGRGRGLVRPLAQMSNGKLGNRKIRNITGFREKKGEAYNDGVKKAEREAEKNGAGMGCYGVIVQNSSDEDDTLPNLNDSSSSSEENAGCYGAIIDSEEEYETSTSTDLENGGTSARFNAVKANHRKKFKINGGTDEDGYTYSRDIRLFEYVYKGEGKDEEKEETSSSSEEENDVGCYGAIIGSEEEEEEEEGDQEEEGSEEDEG
eukprot:CAMPEP_0174253730 /NCGR_PEP_ID=MMETSP0439-20130205/3090_1 /TAXON_ID=0 /ORGANISM="Stereomyxa ramosa, Strain Chinc5" /LENGTH=386 /DNA_ID=CAMNT_0015334913 /DNA_START=35 /DNA_END=1191 /DNA_ORIENTATION=+